MKNDQRRVRALIRAEIRRQAALALERLHPDYFASDFITGRTNDGPVDDAKYVASKDVDLRFASFEQAKLVRNLKQGLAISPLKRIQDEKD